MLGGVAECYGLSHVNDDYILFRFFSVLVARCSLNHKCNLLSSTLFHSFTTSECACILSNLNQFYCSETHEVSLLALTTIATQILFASYNMENAAVGWCFLFYFTWHSLHAMFESRLYSEMSLICFLFVLFCLTCVQ